MKRNHYPLRSAVPKVIASLIALVVMACLGVGVEAAAKRDISANAPVYIDPDSADGDGSFESPHRSWSQVAWHDHGVYLQRRGTVARETLEIGADGVTIGAFGSGAKPVVSGSEVFSDATDWTKVDVDTWALAGLARDPVVFVHDGSLGYRRLRREDLSEQWDYFYDALSERLLVHSRANPATVAKVLEAAVRGRTMDFEGHRDVVIEDLELRHTRGDVAWGGWGAKRRTFRRVDFRQLAGYALQFHNGSSGMVEGCTFIDWGLRNNQDYAIQVIGLGFTESGPVDIRANTFIVNHRWNTVELGAVMSDARGWARRIEFNRVEASGFLSGAAIAVWRPARMASEIVVLGNQITRAGRQGILLQELNYYGANPAVHVGNNLIEEAAVGDELDVEALRVWSHGGDTPVTIAGNRIKGTKLGHHAHDGIRLRNADGTKLIGNEVSGTNHGIAIERGSLRIEARENAVTYNQGFGLFVTEDSDVAVVQDNRFVGNGLGPSFFVGARTDPGGSSSGGPSPSTGAEASR